MEFIHWKEAVPDDPYKPLLMWVRQKLPNDIWSTPDKTTGRYFEPREADEEDCIPETPGCFMDWEFQDEDQCVLYNIIDGELVNNYDGNIVDLYWAYSDEAYGDNPFNRNK